jgi:hypothetical protein
MPSLRIVTSIYRDEHKSGWINQWVVPNHIPHTIYRKNDALEKGEERVIDEHNIEIPNYGRCDYSFLYHIVKNYEKLDDYTIFTKINWQDQGLPIQHLLENVFQYDFIWEGRHRKYTVWSEMTESIRKQIPPETHPHDIENQIFGKHNYGECSYDWYKEFFNQDLEPPVIKSFGHGHVFSLSKELIRRHPKEIYQRLMNKFYPEDGSWDADYQKYGYTNLKEQMIELGKYYHDQFGRFYPLLFTFQADESFRILLT